jgi:superfamily I DNA/RNA helicase
MLDCDEDIIPNKKKSDEMLRKHCELELAREIRNERSLVYVASTRAKDELHIRYNTSLSSLLTEHNYYQQYDMMYESFKPDYNDVLEFQKFYAGEHNG